VRQRPETPGGNQLAGAPGEGRVALGQRHGDEGIEPRRLSRHRIDLGSADPHRLLHQERIAGIEQVVGDCRHLPVPPQRQDEIGAGRGQHQAVVGKSGRIPHLGRPFREDSGVKILDGDQFDIRHGQEVAQIGGVVERMPVADPDGGYADGHWNSPPGSGLAKWRPNRRQTREPPPWTSRLIRVSLRMRGVFGSKALSRSWYRE
jgi:hypothetical protein